MLHHGVRKNVRDTIIKLGGTLPKDLPTPEKSIEGLEVEELNKINF